MKEYKDWIVRYWFGQDGRIEKDVLKELIRCKDCKWHWKSAEWHLKGYCENDKCFDGVHFETDNDFYCGYAERKE